MSPPSQVWIDRFLASLAAVIGALADTPASAGSATAEPAGDGWIVTLAASGGAQGTLGVEFDRSGAEALTMRIVGLQAQPPAEVVVETLNEICAQAAGSTAMEAEGEGARLAVAAVARADGAATPSASVLARIHLDGIVETRLRLWADVAAAPPLAESQDAPAGTASGPKLDIILDIDLPLTVRFGQTELSLRVVAGLGPGSVIDLGRSPDEPVDVLVSNQVVARGEVVVVGGNYGVRITDVMSPADRVRSVEGGIR